MQEDVNDVPYQQGTYPGRNAKHRLLMLLAILVILFVMGGTWLSLYRQQQEYTRNRKLIAALTHGDTETAIVLVNAGADPNTRMSPPPAPSFNLLLRRLLHTAPPSVNNSLTAFMLASGRPLFIPGNRPLPQATLAETPALLRIMLAHGANVQARSLHHTVLHYAVAEGQTSTVELLLEHGSNINAQDDAGQTPLLLAVRNGDANKVKLLLSWGANPNVRDADGESPSQIAENSGRRDIVQLLNRAVK